jgi:hypothetical protein
VLNPAIRSAVLKVGITPEFSSISEIYEEALHRDEATRYEKGLQQHLHDGTKIPSRKPEEARRPLPALPTNSRAPVRQMPSGSAAPGMTRFIPRTAGAPRPRPITGSGFIKPLYNRPPTTSGLPIGGNPTRPPQVVGGGNPPSPIVGANASKPCFEWGQMGHIRNYCPQLRNRMRVAGIYYDEGIIEDPPLEEGQEREQKETPQSQAWPDEPRPEESIITMLNQHTLV